MTVKVVVTGLVFVLVVATIFVTRQERRLEEDGPRNDWCSTISHDGLRNDQCWTISHGGPRNNVQCLTFSHDEGTKYSDSDVIKNIPKLEDMSSFGGSCLDFGSMTNTRVAGGSIKFWISTRLNS